jgi:hypothetical protein
MAVTTKKKKEATVYPTADGKVEIRIREVTIERTAAGSAGVTRRRSRGSR